MVFLGAPFFDIHAEDKHWWEKPSGNMGKTKTLEPVSVDEMIKPKHREAKHYHSFGSPTVRGKPGSRPRKWIKRRPRVFGGMPTSESTL